MHRASAGASPCPPRPAPPSATCPPDPLTIAAKRRSSTALDCRIRHPNLSDAHSRIAAAAERVDAEFRLTGSASPTELGKHSGALRILKLRLRPLALSERGYAPSVSLAERALLASDDRGASTFRDGPFLGALFESLVTLSVRVYAQRSEAQVAHFRMHRGDHEVDLIVERRDGRCLGP